MKKLYCLFLTGLSLLLYSQGKLALGQGFNSSISVSASEANEKVNDSVAGLIPLLQNGKFGFKNQKSKVVIKPQFSNVGFFTEDCNLLNSPNESVKKFGTAEYASVSVKDVDYRIDSKGNKVYQYKNEEKGKCANTYKPQVFNSFVRKGAYGIIDKKNFYNENDDKQYVIAPQYQLLHIMEGTNVKEPMIIAAKDDKFGVIDVHNNIIVPFEYADIKRNYSWKLAHLFEVTKDGNNYFYVDDKNNKY